MLERVSDKLVDNARDWWRWWSIRIMALGAFLHTWITFDAGAVLWLWRMMPEPLSNLIPSQVVSLISVLLFVIGIIMRLTHQNKLNKQGGHSNG